MSLSDYRYRELRFRSLADSDPEESERLLALAEQANVRRWEVYEDMASRSAVDFPEDPEARARLAARQPVPNRSVRISSSRPAVRSRITSSAFSR